MANGIDPPGWSGVSNVWRAIGVIGTPALIAVLALYILNWTLATQQKEFNALTIETRGEMTRLREHNDNTIRMIELLGVICRRMGRNDLEREACR